MSADSTFSRRETMQKLQRIAEAADGWVTVVLVPDTDTGVAQVYPKVVAPGNPSEREQCMVSIAIKGVFGNAYHKPFYSNRGVGFAPGSEPAKPLNGGTGLAEEIPF